jgi:hypothetical protein
VNFAVQHLTDEAVAAYADGVLATPAHNRATRHLVQCAECAVAVDEQRAAVSALRAAPAPALPVGLLDRLRAVPTTTSLGASSLGRSPLALAPDGSAAFAAFGTSVADPGRSTVATAGQPADGPHADGLAHFRFPVAVPHAVRGLSTRSRQLALVTVAAAMLTTGMAASAAATTSGSRPSPHVGSGGGTNSTQVVSVHRKNPIVGDVSALSGHN